MWAYTVALALAAFSVAPSAQTQEKNEPRNGSESVPLAVRLENAPDLVVLGPSVSDRRPESGAAFWFIATVSNQGDAQAAASTVRYLRSTDGQITTSDALEGTDTFGAKEPLQNYAATIRLTAPSTAGTYYYGACVDAVTGESDSTNNCSASVQVQVQEQGGTDDDDGSNDDDDGSNDGDQPPEPVDPLTLRYDATPATEANPGEWAIGYRDEFGRAVRYTALNTGMHWRDDQWIAFALVDADGNTIPCPNNADAYEITVTWDESVLEATVESNRLSGNGERCLFELDGVAVDVRRVDFSNVTVAFGVVLEASE